MHREIEIKRQSRLGSRVDWNNLAEVNFFALGNKENERLAEM